MAQSILQAVHGLQVTVRGPHVNYGFADEMQDWTREAFELFKEVVNLPCPDILRRGAKG